jgi:hypothetical protein
MSSYALPLGIAFVVLMCSMIFFGSRNSRASTGANSLGLVASFVVLFAVFICLMVSLFDGSSNEARKEEALLRHQASVLLGEALTVEKAIQAKYGKCSAYPIDVKPISGHIASLMVAPGQEAYEASHIEVEAGPVTGSCSITTFILNKRSGLSGPNYETATGSLPAPRPQHAS